MYDAVTNTVYYTPAVANEEIMNKDAGLGNVERHEMWHFKQAEDFRSAGFVITEESRLLYLELLRNKCKAHIDMLGIKDYNVSQISTYAWKSYLKDLYDEVEAEYMVWKKGGGSFAET